MLTLSLDFAAAPLGSLGNRAEGERVSGVGSSVNVRSLRGLVGVEYAWTGVEEARLLLMDVEVGTTPFVDGARSTTFDLCGVGQVGNNKKFTQYYKCTMQLRVVKTVIWCVFRGLLPSFKKTAARPGLNLRFRLPPSSHPPTHPVPTMSSSWDSVQNRKEGWKTNKRKRTFPLQLTTTGSSSSTPSSSSSTSSGWMTTKNSQGKTKPNKFVNEASSWSKQTFKKALLKTTSASQTVDPKTMVYDATTNQTVMEALTSLFPYIQDDDISVGSSSSIDTSSSSSKQKANFITRLNPQQLNIVTSVVAGLSTFYTGPAGTGKSHVLSAILRSIEMLNPPANRKQRKSIVLTATTGIAACNIGGVTLHSFAGVGTGAETADKLLGKVSGNEFSKKRWREVDILVIDEVSMMEVSERSEPRAKRASNTTLVVTTSASGLELTFSTIFALSLLS